MFPQIYVIKITEIKEKDINFLYDLIEEPKKTDIKNKLSVSARIQSLIGIILTKVAIKKEFNIPIKEIKFSYKESGKPYIENFKNIHFSISHCQDYVVCAISDKPIGIDIEKIKDVKIEALKTICYLKEKEFIFSEPTKSCENFFKVWTAKEAIYKKSGYKNPNTSKEDVKHYKFDNHILCIS